MVETVMPILKGPTTSVLSPVPVTKFYIDGTDLADWLYGTAYDDDIHGRGGNDVLFGGAGNDTLWGDAGDDYLYGGAGNDTLWGYDGDDYLYGGTGNDWIIGGAGKNFMDGGAGADMLDGYGVWGSPSYDTVSYASSASGVVVNLKTNTASGGDAEGDTFRAIEAINGSNYSDVLFAADWGSKLDGGAGDDAVFGGADSDELFGGAGADRLNGYAGNDRLDGGDGDDTIEDRLGDNKFYGGAGNDDLCGGLGGDRLDGGDGDDRLYGGGGRDLGYGRDIYIGGAGADSFVFAWRVAYDSVRDERLGLFGWDEIDDFSRAEGDKIDLSICDANPYEAGRQAFTFIGMGPFTGHAGEVLAMSGGLAADCDGDGQWDFAITVLGVDRESWQASDFIL
jgi:Ca2+-binding RTX toxin-like protein